MVCPRQNINHSPEKLLVICITRFVFYAKINYQFKTSELKNVEKLEWKIKVCEKLLVICITRFVFYAKINYQFKTSELKNVEKLEWKIKVCKLGLGMGIILCTNLTYIPGRLSLKIEWGPWKVLKKWLQFFAWTLKRFQWINPTTAFQTQEASRDTLLCRLCKCFHLDCDSSFS